MDLNLLQEVLNEEHTAKELSSKLNIPIFKIRSSIRELVEAQILEESGEKYKITEKGVGIIENL